MRLLKYLSIHMTLFLAALGLERAAAADLVLEISGEFGPTTTVNGMALGVETPFSFQAVFDPSNNVNPTTGAGYFRPFQFTIAIAGRGTFAGVPNVDLNVVLLDPSYHLGVYAAGLVTSTGTPFFLNTYSGVAPPYNPSAPTPTTYLGYADTLTSFDETPYIVPLTGGGALVIKDFGEAVPTASLVAVPEPSSLLLCGLSLLIGSLLRSLPGSYGIVARFPVVRFATTG